MKSISNYRYTPLFIAGYLCLSLNALSGLSTFLLIPAAPYLLLINPLVGALALSSSLLLLVLSIAWIPLLNIAKEQKDHNERNYNNRNNFFEKITEELDVQLPETKKIEEEQNETRNQLSLNNL